MFALVTARARASNLLFCRQPSLFTLAAWHPPTSARLMKSAPSRSPSSESLILRFVVSSAQCNAFSAYFCWFSVLARSFMGAVAGIVRWIARDRQLGGRDASGQVDLKSQHELASSMVCVLCLVSCPYQSLALLCRLCFCDIH